MTASAPRVLRTGALAAAALTVAASFAAPPSTADHMLPLLDRDAVGAVDQFGGARRFTGDQSSVIASSIEANRAKNVILIIGDGMGDSEITVARNYLLGAGEAFSGIDAPPLTGNLTHYSVDKATGKPDYTPDSASSGSACATGVKTYDNAISVDRTGKAYQTILQWAKATGRATGDVSTSEIQDATPAVLVANISQRKCYGPSATTKSCPEAALENGGKGSISEQLLDTRPDVTLGGGSATFAEKATAGTYQGVTLEEQAKQRGYTYLTDKADLAKVTSADQTKPLLGLFASGNLPVKFAPLIATPTGADGDAATCKPNPDFAAVPTLGDMTSKAISLLSKNKAGKKKGFFLQVESASIDKRDHAADACGQIGETAQMDDAVKAALDFAKKDGNTLVIVTADHAHTSQILDGPGAALNTKLLTADGSPQHTGTQIRVAGYGPGAANVVGLIDQTDLYFIMRDGMKTYDQCLAKGHSSRCKR